DRIGVVLRGFRRTGQLLVVDPDGFALADDELRQLAAELHFAGGVLRNDELGLELAIIAGPEEADDGGADALAKQLERDADDFVGVAAAEQLHAELVQREEVVSPTLVAKGFDAERGWLLWLQDTPVVNDGLRVVEAIGFGEAG